MGMRERERVVVQSEVQAGGERLKRWWGSVMCCSMARGGFLYV